MAPRQRRSDRGPYPDMTTQPATAERWDDLASIMDASAQPRGCWCQWFRQVDEAWDRGTPDERRCAMRDQLDQESGSMGVIAYAPIGANGQEPTRQAVGWAAVAPVTRYPRAQSEGGFDDDVLQDPSTWFVSCLVVPSQHRRRGVSYRLVEAAFDLARDHGAHRVIAHPVDVGASSNAAADELFHGTLSMYTGCGFVETGRTSPARPLVERVISRRPSH